MLQGSPHCGQFGAVAGHGWIFKDVGHESLSNPRQRAKRACRGGGGTLVLFRHEISLYQFQLHGLTGNIMNRFKKPCFRQN